MKKALYLLVTIFLIISCSTNHLKNFESRDSYFENSSVLGLNAINADYNYYTKAILEYLLVQQIIDGYSKIVEGKPKYNPSADNNVTQLLLFQELNQKENKPINDDDSERAELIESLKEKGLKYCFYDLPKALKDLESGFQFNHYIFRSTNRAAMQAFGIVDSEIQESSLYIITDYLQYKDINCSGLPTIRYAVGMRAQFRISETKTETDLKGIGSLAGLAAQVETNQKSVNITIKTIGITGIDSRLSIPSNTSFDVKTYSDYEKIVDFIRNLKDNVDNNDENEIIIHPQIIPVMDEYRTTIEHTFHPMYESIELLETRLKNLEEDKFVDFNHIAKTRKEIAKIKMDLILDEINQLRINRQTLIKGDLYINDYSNYIDIYHTIKKGLEKSTKEVKIDKIIKILSSSSSNFEDDIYINFYGLNLPESTFKKVKNDLNSNFILNKSLNLSDKPSWFSSESAILYYDDKSLNKALKIKEVINSAVGLDLIVKKGGGYGVKKKNRSNEFRVHIIN